MVSSIDFIVSEKYLDYDFFYYFYFANLRKRLKIEKILGN